MKINVTAKAFKELGHPTRLSIYKQLIKAGEQGIAVGKIGDSIGIRIPSSTLSHHISSLISADLISQHREGRILYCIANYKMRETLINFLQEECCVDSPENKHATE